MLGLIIKIIVCPVIVYLSDMILNDVYFANPYQAVIAGLVVAVVGHLMEVLILKRGTLWISTFADLAGAFIVIYLSQYFLPGSSITVAGAAITALLLTVVEHFQHIYLINQGVARKD